MFKKVLTVTPRARRAVLRVETNKQSINEYNYLKIKNTKKWCSNMQYRNCCESALQPSVVSTIIIVQSNILLIYTQVAILPEAFNSEKHFSCASITKGSHSVVLFAIAMEAVAVSLLMVPSSFVQPFFLAMHSMKH
jgi:hypothetical protein